MCFLLQTLSQIAINLQGIENCCLKEEILSIQLVMSGYMHFHSLLSVTSFVTIIIFTMVLERGGEVLRLHMIPDHTPPTMAELSTDGTHPLAASWGLAAEAKQIRGGLASWIVTITSLGNNRDEFLMDRHTEDSFRHHD